MTMTKKNQKLFAFLRERSAETITAEGIGRKLGSGRRLRVKLGVDPTSPELHLGHLVPVRLLRAFQDAGHTAVLIVGDFTGRIGDPTGQSATRRELSAAEVKRNERTYLRQIGRVLNIRRAEIHHNSEWFSEMRLHDFLRLLAQISLPSVTAREDFQERLRTGRSVGLHEAMYPVLQGYDSVMVKADIELGALDQKLNILTGRELQVKLGQPPQDVILVPYLIGLDGVQKMSKSVRNTIDLEDSPDEMFGKVMSIPDGLIRNYAELAAWYSRREVEVMIKRLGRENPRDVKFDLAEAIVGRYHGARAAARARARFVKTFSRREAPALARSIRLPRGRYTPLELLERLGAVRSKSEARRLASARAVEVDGRIVTPRDEPVDLRRGSVIRIGKKRFWRVR